jgi:hypothetical protein
MVVIFFLGTLLGVVVAQAFCIRYLRREMTADIVPRLRRIQLQLDNVESALSLAVASRCAELGSRSPQDLVR